MKKNPQLLNYIIKLKQQGLKNTQIARKIKEELWIILTSATIWNWLKEVIDNKQKEVSKLKQQIEYINPFKIEWENIIFYYKDWDITKKMSIPINEVRAIWEDYVEHGWNLTQQEILVKYNLNPKAWFLIKNRLWLYKKSDIIPDWLLEHIEKTEWEAVVKEEIKEVTHRAVINKYKNKIIKDYIKFKDKEYERSIKQLYNIENFLKLLWEFIKEYKPKSIKFNKIKNVWNDIAYVVMSDIHLWKEETDNIKERIKQITADIINRKEKKIIIFILWDIVENLVVWGMHKWQIEHMDWPYNFDLIMDTVNVLEQMLIAIRKAWKKVTMIWQVWNHWRMSERDYMDYTWELIIYEMIKRWLSTTDIEIDYMRDIWWTYTDKNFHFILQHWHLNWVKKKTKDILWEFWDNRKFNIILQWHIHVWILEDSSKNATRIIAPALAGSWHYDKALWLSSYPGYIIITKNKHWLPDTLFVRLP